MDKHGEKLARASRLKQAREKAGISSPRAAARKFGWNEETYKAHETGRNGFDNDAGRAYAAAFDISFAWLMTGETSHIDSDDVTNGQYKVEADFPPDPDQAKAARKKARRQLEPGELVEVDVIGGLGPGGFAPEIVIDGQVVDNLRATWRVPQDFLHSELRAREIDVEIFPVEGDSMTPTLTAGDRVLVNRRQNMLSQDGLYAITGPTGVQVKRLQYVQGTNDPVKVMVISDNALHRSPELSIDEINIIGRVICRISRL
ncbi:S24 family peptidase [Xanthobacter flavus]|uniref:LexA family transcriptional regulator n=1 Tax=Xanthobacter flavus TaxID=281 RepID=UPI0037289AF9